MTEHVITTDAGDIRTIRINRPDKKNALALAMYEAMSARGRERGRFLSVAC